MGYFIDVAESNAKGFTYVYSGVSYADLENLIDTTMSSSNAVSSNNKYKHLGQGVYESGKRIMRLIFNFYYPYYKFKITLDGTDSQNIKVNVLRLSTGWSGGVFGVFQVKKEINRLKKIYKEI